MMNTKPFSGARYALTTGIVVMSVLACLTGFSSPGFARDHPDASAPLAVEQVQKTSENLTKTAQRRLKRRSQRRRPNNRRAAPRRAPRGYNNQQSRRAVSAGKAMSLGQVARNVRRRVPGQLLDARLINGRNGKLVYRLKILGKNGVVRNVTADAHTGGILGVR